MNTWHHIAIEYKRSATASDQHIYIDGSECSYKTSINGGGAPLIVFPPILFYMIDSADVILTDFAYWTVDETCTAQELAELANSKVEGMALQIDPGNLKHYFPFDECRGGDTTCNDWNDRIGGTDLTAHNDAVGRSEEILSYP